MDVCGLPNRYVICTPMSWTVGSGEEVGLAWALAVDPKFIVCDEPFLPGRIHPGPDSVCSWICRRKGTSYMFITHDLCVVRLVTTTSWWCTWAMLWNTRSKALFTVRCIPNPGTASAIPTGSQPQASGKNSCSRVKWPIP